jgi:hypothetical protein
LYSVHSTANDKCKEGLGENCRQEQKSRLTTKSVNVSLWRVWHADGWNS